MPVDDHVGIDAFGQFRCRRAAASGVSPRITPKCTFFLLVGLAVVPDVYIAVETALAFDQLVFVQQLVEDRFDSTLTQSLRLDGAVLGCI